ncbi:hypothetical protein [Cohnella nanjingensis]|uniref:Uncharacterized protein n=1 Tax=Cohnella nanjingensis TaxID=1387779 RepID=A0A7X0VHT8_9BACL|nr:hypothetical protein [Cohnella nanjingensis]MBB6674485.1 hypothetical protein [Cohnella nanjingensis]
MYRTHIPVRPFNPKRPGALVGVITTVSEYLGVLYGIIAETRSAGSNGPCTECGGTVAPAEIDPGRMIAPELSLKNGAVLLWAGTDCAPVPRIRQLAAMLGIDYLRPHWERIYHVDEYIKLLEAFSGHILMEEWKRDKLFNEIRVRLNRRPEKSVSRHWGAVLHVARENRMRFR